jgi:hypothetical protein
MLDLAGHDRFFDTFIFEKAQHLTELAYTHPGNRVSHLLNLGIGLFADGGNGYVDPGTFCSFEHEKGELSVACDQTELHGVG